MKKFGFGKKSEGEDDDRNRSGIFGRKKPAPQDDNPYAQQPAEDPYARMTPYQQARANLAAGPQGPRPGTVGLSSGPGIGLPSGPAPRNGYGTPPPSYQGSPQVAGGYAPDKLGAAGGYGSNRYDTSSSPHYTPARSSPALPSQRFQSRGPGGYGGLGSADTDVTRDEMFAGGGQRQAPPPSYASTDNTSSGTSGAAGASYGGDYGEQRELTEEEIEKQELYDTKNQTRDVGEQSVNSLDNALMHMQNAIDTGRGTLVRLGQQGEMLHNAEKNLDLAHNHRRIADEKTDELRTLNGSMFAAHVSNPFTSKSRQALRDQQILEQHHLDSQRRDATRKSAFAGTQQMEQTFRDLDRPTLRGQTSSNAAERSKYVMEDDSDEEYTSQAIEREQKIEEQTKKLENGVGVLNTLAKAAGSEVKRQGNLINDLSGKTGVLGDGLVVTRNKLNNIH